ncbi:hypothetical protein NL532_31925 [Mesorhizobium sp. C120A]|uniref:hypothetical protein n=1 Tax=unclassified Mesorhizobium TaxID=325217 RepID=UPI0003CFB285|nr:MULTISPECIES: hypothetical protein [unclassified Mesorhizobium]ESZ63739.1 hypothetical protein X728_08905 [Mesorhizobium sp. L103C120A0]WJI45052.1 hypothetical protein NL532_31925 [Mesorhizobium sp. C120A]
MSTQHPLSDQQVAEFWPGADPADIRRQFDALIAAGRREWLIRKYGYFYRPNRAGYTMEKVAAGRYTKVEADREAAVEPHNFTVMHESEVPDAPEVETLKARLATAERERDRLHGMINSPETEDWLKGATLEAAHQIERYSAEHDAGKNPLDWFWLIGYLAQKATSAALAGDTHKAKHHTISTAAALLNWHRHLTGESTLMRPGIEPRQ